MPITKKLTYWMVQDPLKGKETFAFDYYLNKRTLRRWNKKRPLKREIYIPSSLDLEKEEIEELIDDFEGNTESEGKLNEAYRDYSWYSALKRNFSLGIGGGISATFAPQLFTAGYDFLTAIPYIGDLASRAMGGPVMGGIFVVAPFLTSWFVTRKYGKQADEATKCAEALEEALGKTARIKSEAFISDQLAKFWSDTESIKRKMKEAWKSLAEDYEGNLEKIQEGFGNLSREAKLAGSNLIGLGEYYHYKEKKSYEAKRLLESSNPLKKFFGRRKAKNLDSLL